MLIYLSAMTGCVSETDSRSSDSLLLTMMPSYVDGFLSDDIYSSDDYTIKEFYPMDYTLYDKNTDMTYTLGEDEAVPNVNLELTLDITAPGKDLYFIFTNISPSAQSDYPALNEPEPSIQQSLVAGSTASKPDPVLTGTGTRGKPEATEFNRNPYASLNRINPVNMLLNLVPTAEPVADVAGSDPSKKNFKIDRYVEIAATCRYVSPTPVATGFGDKTLNIWVADNCWHTSTSDKKSKVTPSMVSAMADKFLHEDTYPYNDDIYDWVTAIYGEEWGEIPSSSPLSEEDRNMLIAPDDEITILLFDIDNDNSTSGGVLGYFWAKDNFRQSEISYSNERIMFYMDAVLFATKEDSFWDMTDRWPSEIISTLAHEFQHMIQFYQKTVLRTDGSSGTETWIDEMCSLATEDLVSNKLGVNGPRGAYYMSAACEPDPDDPAPGDLISYGRLPIANYFNEYSVTAWYGGSYKLISYSLNYAFGSYLSRNYGGALFFRDVVQNEYTDYRAIEYALGLSGVSGGDRFGTALRKWAASNLLSDREDTPADYEYNNGYTWFASSASSIDYDLGSIDLYYYRYQYSLSDYQVGPYIYTRMRTGEMPAASSIYYRAGENVSGIQTWNIKLRSNVRLTVIAR